MKLRLLLAAMFAAFLLFVVGCAAPAPTLAPTSAPPAVAPAATSVPPTAAPAATTAPTAAATSAPAAAAATATTAPTKPPATAAATNAPAKLSMTDVVLVSSSVSPPSISNIYYYGALDGGFFKKNGLNVTPQQSGGSPLSIAAITSGTAQFASVNLTTLSNAVAEGGKLKLVVTGNFDFPGMILASEKIKTINDLANATMGTATLGSNEYTLAMTYLKAKGIDTSKIQWVATGGSNLSIQALAAGRIDATWAPMSNAVDGMNKYPQIHALVSAKSLTEVVPASGGIVVVTEDFMNSHADVVQAFVNAVIEGNRYLQANVGNYATVANGRMPGIYTQQQIQELYEGYSPSFGVNGGLAFNVLSKDFEIWRTQVNPAAAKKANMTKVEQEVETKFVSVALDKLGIIKGQLDTASWKQ